MVVVVMSRIFVDRFDGVRFVVFDGSVAFERGISFGSMVDFL